MRLNRYGFLYQQYLQQNEPEEYKKMLESNTLIKVITKKQNEILEYRNKLYEKVEKDELFRRENFSTEMDYELAVKEYVENEISKNMISTLFKN